MYDLINLNAPSVIDALGSLGDLNDYLHLRVQLIADYRLASDPDFQKSYRKYWRMNAARLPEPFFSQYFDVLARCQHDQAADLPTVTRTISHKGRRKFGLQFSFATKLVHMVDPRVPVFDSFVAAFYFFRPPPPSEPLEDRLATLLEFHGFLGREYARVIRMGLLAPAIEALRAEHELDATVPDERVIDWLIWAWVSLLRLGAQSRGQALYE